MSILRHRILVIVPAFNEARRIESPLKAYIDYARTLSAFDFRFLIVLNGCRDDTAVIIGRLAAEYPEVSWMEYVDPVGKGGALVAGFREATGFAWVGFADADGATPARDFFGLLEKGSADVVIGCRDIRRRPLGRRITSYGFNFIVRRLLGLHLRDTQCGAKFFRCGPLATALARVSTCDMAIDVDLLLRLQELAATFEERRVEWHDQPGSSVKVFRTSSLMFLSVWRLYLLQGRLGWMRRRLLSCSEWFYHKIKSAPRTHLPGKPDRAFLRLYD